jgi:formylmethanofuran dehydrogenase subunit E
MEITQIGKVVTEDGYRAGHFENRHKENRIVIEDEYVEELYRLQDSKHIHVLFGVSPQEGDWHRCLTDCGEVRGVFATRSPMRPSSLESATVELLEVEGNTLRVRGLNALDGSPVFDLKPFVPVLDAIHVEEERTADLKRNPRLDFMQAIFGDDRVRCLVKTAEIHGHFCPGSALGVMASLCGLRRLGLESLASDGLEHLMAVVEINACFADGIQAVSGCTLGNNSLVYRDLGRHAVTFAVRGNATGARVRVRPDFRSRIDQAVPEFYPLMEKVIKNRAGSAKEEAAFKEKAREAAFALIELPFEDLLFIETVRPVLPDYAPVTESAICPNCGESIMGTKMVRDGDGRGLCLMCAGRGYRQVEGQGIVEKETERGEQERNNG